MPKKMSFKGALAIQQTGARRVGPNRYALGGGIFSGKQLRIARARYGVSQGIPKQKAFKMVGLRLR